jgi:predicted SnoaL-like aldol condensation-catalyzing enzyme
VHWLRGQFPDLRLDIKRVIAEGDSVVTHSNPHLKPGDRGMAVADFWRVADGKIVEHWDVIQEVPEKSANDNTMF